MKQSEYDRIYNAFKNKINSINHNTVKKVDVKSRLKDIYDSIKQSFDNALIGSGFRDLEEFPIYLKRYSYFLQNIVHYFFKLYYSNKYFDIGISGSTAKNLSDLNSDLDLVIVTRSNSKIDWFNIINISELTDFFSTNIDLVIITNEKSGVVVTEDIIDRLIAFTPQIIYSDISTTSNFNLHLNADFINQLFIEQLLLGFMPMPPEKSSNDIKYCKGGLRDIIFLLENIGRLNIENKKNSEECIKQIECNATRNYMLLKMNELTNHLTNNEIEKIITQNSNYKDELIIHFFEKRLNIPYSFYAELINRYESNNYFTSEEYRNILSSHKYQPLKLLILSTTSNVFQIIKGNGIISKKIAYPLVANRYTPSHILHKIALNNGYEWRNIRDQVLKHKNISSKTVHLLANDDIAYTRKRAKSLIE